MQKNGTASISGKKVIEIIVKVLLWIVRAIGFLLRKFVEYFFNILITLLLVFVITAGIVATVFAIYIRDNIDPTIDIDSYVDSLNQTSFVYYTDYLDSDRTIGSEKEYSEIKSSVNRVWASVSPEGASDTALVMPEHLVNAFIAVEDKRFYEHSGVDWVRTGGAFIELATKFSKSYGGSTLTQQLIKNLTGEDDTTIQRKLQEILRALYLERSMQAEFKDSDDPKYQAKERILEVYLNTIFLSESAYGVQAAAQTYFSKNVSELTLVEAAAIASIPQNPYRWNPARYPENNKGRRNNVLTLMYEQNMISEEEYREAINTELVINMNTEENSTNSYILDYTIECVVKDLVEEYGYTETLAKQLVYGGGLQIYSTVDPDIQTILEDIYADDSNFPVISDGIQPQSAMVITDPYTGKLLAMVGGRGKKSGSVLNRAANSRRQPGSTIKPLAVYAPAIDKGIITWGSVIDDTPINFNSENKATWPRNANRTYRGLTTVKYALQQSLNTIPVKIMQELGPRSIYHYLTSELDITTLVESEKTSSGAVLSDIDLSPLSLGALTYGANLLEFTNAYNMFPNGGVFTESIAYTKVLDKNGAVILSNEEPVKREVISPQTSTIMTMLLKNVVQNGTASRVTLKSKIEVAGKTGSTDDNKDLWFIGYTPYYLAGVWFGYDIPKYISGSSVAPPVQIWDKVMTKVHEEIFEKIRNGDEKMRKFKTYEETGNIVVSQYCMDSGLLPSEACYNDMRGNRIETGYYISGTEPTKECDVHVNVLYDTATKSVATEFCPQENLKVVSLINVDREFPFYLAVTDAQYTFRQTPEGFVYAYDDSKPFYFGLRTFSFKDHEGNDVTWPYYGISANLSHVNNSICSAHAHPPAPEPEEGEELTGEELDQDPTEETDGE